MDYPEHFDQVPVEGPRCVAIDLGAASGRLIAGQICNGRWQLAELRRFQTPFKRTALRNYESWDLEAVHIEISSGLQEWQARGSISSVGVDGWGVDYVLLDENRQPVGVPVCYRDSRTAGVMKAFEARISKAEIYRRTGIQFLPFNTLYQLAASATQEPAWMSAARHMLMIPDYLHYRLCGQLANEYTNATTTQMCDLEGHWDQMLVEAAGINSEMLMDPISPGTVLGDGIGAARGMKVIAPASHDTASAVVGTPLMGSNEAYISSGTWSLMGIESNVPIVTSNSLAMNFTNEGGFDRRFRILKNIMGTWPLQRICEEHAIADLPTLVQQSEECEPWRSVVDINSDVFLNPRSMRDSLRAYCSNSGQPVPESLAQLARCIFDSLSLSYAQVKKQLEQLRGRTISKVQIVGGGSRNDMLNQLCADACELPVSAGPVEASALGNLSVQMITLGEIENLEAARQLIRRSFTMKEFQPKASVPAQTLRRFNELCAAGELEGEPCT